ncbi:hypothetical protein E2C01_001496 [Portunus trituberculatus]|uniref:Uncharacterized protein n=1 Tax=Portunus trituberculatus TaxID=210409 RepID=A0A5B7CHT1_PORTR|nr:hypothetical protein [Portunus trituberculatus]
MLSVTCVASLAPRGLRSRDHEDHTGEPLDRSFSFLERDKSGTDRQIMHNAIPSQTLQYNGTSNLLCVRLRRQENALLAAQEKLSNPPAFRGLQAGIRVAAALGEQFSSR